MTPRAPGLQRRLVLLLVLAVAPASFLTLYYANRIRRADEALAADALLGQARPLALRQEDQVRGAATALTVFTSPLGPPRGAEGCARVLESLRDALPGSDVFGVVDGRGEVACSSDMLEEPLRLTHPGLWQSIQETARSGEPSTGVYSLAATGRPYLSLARPVPSDADITGGIAFRFVEIASELGQGTEVSLYFPLGGVVAPEVAERSPAPPRQEVRCADDRSAAIVLVEDNEAIRRGAAKALRRSGYIVHEAPNGAVALDFLRSARDSVDLVISDMDLPRMGGLELLQAIRSSGNDVPFLVTSGHAQAAETVRAHALGAHTAFLPKPWTASELLKKVNALLDAAHARSGEGIVGP